MPVKEWGYLQNVHKCSIYTLTSCICYELLSCWAMGFTFLLHKLVLKSNFWVQDMSVLNVNPAKNQIHNLK